MIMEKIKRMYENGEIVVICAYCKKHKINNKWVEYKDMPKEYKYWSHGICNECYKKVIRRWKYED